MRFTAGLANVVLTAKPTLESGKRYYSALKERAHSGNDDQVLVMPGIVPVVGRTKEEASEKLRRLQSDTHMDVLIGTADHLQGDVTDLRSVNLDSLEPAALPLTNFNRSRQNVLLDLAVRQKVTLRQLIRLVSDSRPSHGRWYTGRNCQRHGGYV